MFEIFRYAQNDNDLRFLFLSESLKIIKSLSYWAFTRKRSIHKFKYILNSVEISPTAQYDNIEFLLRLVSHLVANAQNDKRLILLCCKSACNTAIF